ncbi:hypothetical protein [Frankia sp. CiP3]|nr:hypothetical protein [Frankia sp. CiP3]
MTGPFGGRQRIRHGLGRWDGIRAMTCGNGVVWDAEAGTAGPDPAEAVS